MQSFLAESAPHRGRALALASAGLVVLVALAATLGGHHRGHRLHHAGHHRLHTVGHCATGTLYYVR